MGGPSTRKAIRFDNPLDIAGLFVTFRVDPEVPRYGTAVSPT